MIKNMKHKIISFWLSHIFLRRIAKRYPEYFVKWMEDLTDDKQARQIMYMRYSNVDPYKFETIAFLLNIAPRRVFEKHKKVLDRIIGSL